MVARRVPAFLAPVPNGALFACCLSLVIATRLLTTSTACHLCCLLLVIVAHPLSRPFVPVSVPWRSHSSPSSDRCPRSCVCLCRYLCCLGVRCFWCSCLLLALLAVPAAGWSLSAASLLPVCLLYLGSGCLFALFTTSHACRACRAFLSSAPACLLHPNKQNSAMFSYI